MDAECPWSTGSDEMLSWVLTVTPSPASGSLLSDKITFHLPCLSSVFTQKKNKTGVGWACALFFKVFALGPVTERHLNSLPL